MTDNQNRIEYLEGALAAVNDLNAKKEQLEEQQKLYKQATQEYDALMRQMEREQEAIVKERRREIETEFDKQLRTAQDNLTEAQNERDKVRKAGVEDRIKAETAPLRTANQGQQDSINLTLKQAGLPGFCGSKWFLTLFAPRGIGEVAILFLVALICLVVIPYIAVQFVDKLIWQILLFALIDLAFLGLYALVYAKTVKDHIEAVNACHDIMDLIKINEKKIKEITKQIKNDTSDAPYDLAANDNQIAQLTLTKNDVANNRQQALTTFDTQTSVQLKNDISSRYNEELAAKKAAAEQHIAATKSLNEQIVADEMKMNETYSQYLGIRKMNAESLTEMIEEEKREQQSREAAAAAAAAARAAAEEAKRAEEAAMEAAEELRRAHEDAAEMAAEKIESAREEAYETAGEIKDAHIEAVTEAKETLEEAADNARAELEEAQQAWQEAVQEAKEERQEEVQKIKEARQEVVQEVEDRIQENAEEQPADDPRAAAVIMDDQDI